MASIVANEDSVDGTTFSTSLDPYGQLVRVLMPRASYVAIYDRLSTPLWLSDGHDGANLLHLVEESLSAIRERTRNAFQDTIEELRDRNGVQCEVLSADLTTDVGIHAVEAGPADGPLVLMVHGFPESWDQGLNE